MAIESPARADSRHVCARVDGDTFSIDGMFDDWSGVNRGTRAGGRSRDAAMVLRCAYDDARLYLLVNVRDDKVIRTRQADAQAEDSVSIELSLREGAAPLKIRAFPGTPTGGPKRTGAPAGAEVEDSLQEQGFSVEAALPWSRLDGWSPSAPALRARITFHDADRATERRVEDVGFTGTIELAHAVQSLRAFLAATKLSRDQIRVDVLADVDPGEGVERVVAGGKIVGVLSDTYTFLELPVRSAADVLAVQVIDFAGDGRAEIVAHYRQHGNGGSRDVVSVFKAQASGFETSLAFEVRKQLGDRKLENRWRIVPAGQHRKVPAKERKKLRGHDILIEVGPVVGWDEDSWEEQPATDVKPILLPWEDRTRAVYYFDGDVALAGEAK